MSARARQAPLLAALAFAAGSVDALSYLGLGRVFTANMTGNTVLLGVAIAQGNGTEALRSLVALGTFCAGGAAGIVIIAGRRGDWARLAGPVLALEALALGALLAVWSAAGAPSTRLLLVGLFGAAMGAQSAAARVSGVPGVATTYITSTLLNAVAWIVVRTPRTRRSGEDSSVPGAVWATYAVGALAGAGAHTAGHAAAAAIPFVIVAGVAVIVLVGAAKRHPATASGDD